jgi:DNA polymerase-4
VSNFGKAGHIYYQNARAIDERPVQSQRIRKSVSSETTFEKDLNIYEDLIPELENVARDVIRYISKNNYKGRTVSLKIKYADFRIISRSKTFPAFISDYETLFTAGSELLKLVDLSTSVRLIGIGIRNNELEEVSLPYDTQLSIGFKEDK